MNMNSNNAGGGGGSLSGCANGGHGNDRGAGGNGYSGTPGSAQGGSVWNSGSVMNVDSSECSPVSLIHKADLPKTTPVLLVFPRQGVPLEAMCRTIPPWTDHGSRVFVVYEVNHRTGFPVCVRNVDCVPYNVNTTTTRVATPESLQRAIYNPYAMVYTCVKGI